MQKSLPGVSKTTRKKVTWTSRCWSPKKLLGITPPRSFWISSTLLVDGYCAMFTCRLRFWCKSPYLCFRQLWCTASFFVEHCSPIARVVNHLQKMFDGVSLRYLEKFATISIISNVLVFPIPFRGNITYRIVHGLRSQLDAKLKPTQAARKSGGKKRAKARNRNVVSVGSLEQRQTQSRVWRRTCR